MHTCTLSYKTVKNQPHDATNIFNTQEILHLPDAIIEISMDL